MRAFLLEDLFDKWDHLPAAEPSAGEGAGKIKLEELEVIIADQFDLLAHIAFDHPVRARSERATACTNREQRFIGEHDPAAQEVVLALLDKYRVGGVEEMIDSRVFRLSPFREMGKAVGVIRRFGGREPLRTTVQEMQERLYPA